MNASWMTIPVVAPDYYSTPYEEYERSMKVSYEEYETSTCPKDEETIVIPEQFRHIFYGDEESELVFAGMANPSNTPDSRRVGTVSC